MGVAYTVENFCSRYRRVKFSIELLTFLLTSYVFVLEDCAALLLTCLYCRFHEFMALLPGTCVRAVRRCFPSYKYIIASGVMDEQGLDCCGHQLELECNLFNSCQDPSELVELAMEISEVCYR